jgi:hypothetical protein
LHQRFSPLANFLKRHFEIAKLLGTKCCVRATLRTRRSSALSTRLTEPVSKRPSTAILIEPVARSTIEPIVIDRQWTFMEEDFQHPEIRIAEAGIFTSGLSKTIGFWTYLGANRVETNPLSSAASPQ